MLDSASENEDFQDARCESDQSPPGYDSTTLRRAFGRFATGVTIVTTQTEAGPLAMTANSFSSVSLDPPLVIWAVGRHSRRFDAFARGRFQAIHVLADDQLDLCWRFSRTGTDFSGLDLRNNAEGAPLLPSALARFECEIVNRVNGGDHLVLLGRIMRLTVAEGEPLVFAAGRYGRLAAAGP
ncbi:MAG: flavin reductase [Phyllobacteriaceae bacterium]|nr:flavin reductase [Phyllobacteriaceae bacterium]